jgi:hypothetical protein
VIEALSRGSAKKWRQFSADKTADKILKTRRKRAKFGRRLLTKLLTKR